MDLTRRTLLTSAGGLGIAATLPAQSIELDWNTVDLNVVMVAQGLLKAGRQAEAHGAMRAMYAQWETCGLNQWADQHLPILWNTPIDPQIVTNAAAEAGIPLPDGWWDGITQAMRDHPGQRTLWHAHIAHMLEYGIKNPWWAVGGFGLVLLGAAAIALGTPVIAGLGLAVAAIGVAFIVSANL